MNGWLVLDKPLGITSAHAINKIKRLLPRGSKIGHAGTLDPLASGVLPIALGEATKTVQFCMDKVKSYAFEVSWGQERATDDAEGEVVAESNKRPTEEEIALTLPQFTGKIQQLPPSYSAIKVDGRRAYDLARSGEAVELKAREVEIYNLRHCERNDGKVNKSDFQVTCGKGTYIRSIARDMGRQLGCFGYVSALRRTTVGKFSENDAISLEKLEELVHKGDLTWLHPVASVLDDIPARGISPAEAARLKAGQFLPISQDMDGLVVAMQDSQLIAICQAELGLMKPVRVFNL